jgi:NitT/TauT family transport system ATP-binding protein
LTIVLVTHDVDEAVFMSDRIAVLSNRPSVVEKLETTALPRPRESMATRELPRFMALRAELVTHLITRQKAEAAHA